MSYRIPDSASLETLLDYVTDVIAGLEAVAELAVLAAPWRTLRADLRQDRDARDDARWTLRAAQRKTAVLDVQWDRALVDLSGRAFLAAGKKAGLEPYASLFGGISADEATRLGPHKAAALGTLVAEKAKAFANPELTAAVTALEAATPALEAAAAVRDDVALKAQLHEITRLQRHLAVEKQIALSEVAVLTVFPGRSDLVRATLAPERTERAAKATVAQGPAPEVQPPAMAPTPAA